MTEPPEPGTDAGGPEDEEASDHPDPTGHVRTSTEEAEAAESPGRLAALGFPPLRRAVEAILMVADEPVSAMSLAQVLERPTGEVLECLQELVADYSAQGRGFELREVAGGWRYYTASECAPVVERFVLEGQQARLTQAALETLAVVAYRQPVSRGRVAAVRGVNVDGVMRTLMTRGLVEECGTEPDSAALLYRTTNYFLERIGLRSLDELPELAPHLPEIDSIDGLDPEDSAV